MMNRRSSIPPVPLQQRWDTSCIPTAVSNRLLFTAYRTVWLIPSTTPALISSAVLTPWPRISNSWQTARYPAAFGMHLCASCFAKLLFIALQARFGNARLRWSLRLWEVLNFRNVCFAIFVSCLCIPCLALAFPFCILLSFFNFLQHFRRFATFWLFAAACHVHIATLSVICELFLGFKLTLSPFLLLFVFILQCNAIRFVSSNIQWH